MCYLCDSKPVYEFTNKRKLCARCFVNYFQKKFLYTLRKFNLIENEDVIGYKKSLSLKSVVLENLLGIIAKKYNIRLVKLPNKSAKKIAVTDSLDSESNEIVSGIISGNAKNLVTFLPSCGRIIKPLYLFLDEEIKLYAKIKKLSFKKCEKVRGKLEIFLEEIEEKHPEVKRAIVNSLLKISKKD